ncbi:MAG: tRNA (adenosine(37)-N6)-dimethylallyltransferase MiaA, partial [Chloroflexota bacterium]|nr:tRNA (adenosine(37)-N6)-dimethylallyltransferase MiaA [Chloroflexota bacterium]
MDSSNNRPTAEQRADPLRRDGAGGSPLVVVAGPTAVGKTALGVELARRFDGEVVSADSRYLYRGLDIGVAKPDADERRRVPHHLIDVVPPHGEMSLATYQDLAYAAIAGVLARSRLPLLVGGTPLYVNAVVEGWRIPRVPPNPALRAALEAEAATHGVPALLARLRAIDPVAAERSGTNLRRIVRALEVYEATGVPMSRQEGKGPRPFVTLELGLTMPRDALHRAVDRRVDDQIAGGLVAEVRALLDGGLDPAAPAMSSLGYRQLLPYLRGEEGLTAAVARIKTDTHRYVRHQETWLRRNPRLIPIDVTEPGWQAHATQLVERFLTEHPIPVGGVGAT